MAMIHRKACHVRDKQRRLVYRWCGPGSILPLRQQSGDYTTHLKEQFQSWNHIPPKVGSYGACSLEICT